MNLQMDGFHSDVGLSDYKSGERYDEHEGKKALWPEDFIDCRAECFTLQNKNKLDYVFVVISKNNVKRIVL